MRARCPTFVFVFFFQAEDGIRDLVRSRGLGDVYKRQIVVAFLAIEQVAGGSRVNVVVAIAAMGEGIRVAPVSYTHLTLPTSDLV